jgi:hypothetical protein
VGGEVVAIWEVFVNRKKKFVGKNGFEWSFYFGLALMLTIFYLLFSKLISGTRVNRQLGSTQTALVVAVISREKVFLGNSPVSRQYYYRYWFKLDGSRYSGDSRDPSKQPGDTILVQYYLPDPSVNEPVIK